MLQIITIASVVLALAVFCPAAHAQRDFTCFQTAAPWSPELDVGSDMAIVYGVNASFSDRLAGWRAQGYATGMMTGIAWGGYDDYYMTPDGLKKDEIQTTKTGRLYMHGSSTTVGYNVPSPDYVAYMKRNIDPAIDAKVQAIFFEEPEYWAETGWSEGFKKEWERCYGEPWRAPDSSVDAQYKASLLKYELYFNALKEVSAHTKQRAAQLGVEIACHVPTHSLVNYAQWRIVSPESHLMHLDDMDGYIAQVWTGTARTHNVFAGVAKSRTFEAAYLEYAQMLAMVRPTGRKVWFLADPIEDNPNRSWADYKENYEATVLASLLFPEVHHYEVMPWPNRIFKGDYPMVDLDLKKGERAGIPADYASEILTIINALNDMKQEKVRWDAGTQGIGLVISDTLMFQRAAPQPSDPHLAPVFGLALPFVKCGVPLQFMQLETILQEHALDNFKVLLVTFEGQKVLEPAYLDALKTWVSGGGGLVVVGDGSDPYHAVSEWWNDAGKTEKDLYDHVDAWVDAPLGEKPTALGKGWLMRVPQAPSAIQQEKDGGAVLRAAVRELLAKQGEALAIQNHVVLRRGPYVIAKVFDESPEGDGALRLEGDFIDLLTPGLDRVAACTLQPGELAFLYDADQAGDGQVMAASTRIRDARGTDTGYHFTTRGPKGTTARIRVKTAKPPTAVRAMPPLPNLDGELTPEKSECFITFENQARDVEVTIEF